MPTVTPKIQTDDPSESPTPAPVSSTTLDPTKAPSGSPTSEQGTGSGDVHVHHAGGGTMDVRGIDGAVVNMHQAANISINARFTYTNFSLPAADRRSLKVREVQGSHLTAAYATARTNLGGLPALVLVKYAPPHVHGKTNDAQTLEAHVLVKDQHTQQTLVSTRVAPDRGSVVVGDVSVEMRYANPVELVVSNTHWRYAIAPGTFRTVTDDLLGPPHNRVDIAITAITDPLMAAVAPHGIIGQGFDGKHIDGKKDNYLPDSHGVFRTYAQGEGGIEGTIDDYVIDPNNSFSTQFKFDRFERVTAPPRDTSLLTPVVAQPAGGPRSLAGAMARAAGDEVAM